MSQLMRQRAQGRIIVCEIGQYIRAGIIGSPGICSTLFTCTWQKVDPALLSCLIQQLHIVFAKRCKGCLLYTSAIAVIGIVIVVATAMRDFEINRMKQHPVACADTNDSNEELEDFLQ